VLTLTPAALGQHHYTASFAPANPDEFAGSTTADATLVVVTEAKDPPTDPQPPVDPDPPIADGGVLQWGVLKRFIDYVEGPIASGKVTVFNGADKSEAPLVLVGDKLEAKGSFKVGAGAKALAEVSLNGKPAVAARFTLK